MEDHPGNDRDQNGDQKCIETALADRAWNDQAAIIEIGNAKQRNALPRPRQRGEHREIPEQHLEQDRQVADKLDIAAGDARDQPVRRQPPERHDEADQGGKEDADDRDQNRVDQPDQEDPRVGVGTRIRNQALADVKACGVVEEPKAGSDPLVFEIGPGIDENLVADPDQDQREQDLQEKTVPPGPAAERALQPKRELRRWGPGFDAHNGASRELAAISGSAARTGFRPCSRGCSARAKSAAWSRRRHCGRRICRNCRPP